MKSFAIFIGKILLLVVLLALLLDIAYTAVYLNTTDRNKIEAVINSKNKNFEVLFMGSSRTQNHMVAKIFNDKGIKAFNYGMSGSKLDETALLLKLMLANHYKIKTIFLDVDLNLNSNSFSNGVRAQYMPYLHTSEVIQRHYQNLPDYPKWYYIPFYRYIANDAKIGFREMYASLVTKKTNALDHDGFYPLRHEGKNMTYDLSDYSPKRNKAYEEIKALCRKNHIRLIAIANPMCQECDSDAYFKRIKSVYPEVHNYENKVNEDRYFSSCGHMNEEGAKQLTTLILNDFLENKFKP